MRTNSVNSPFTSREELKALGYYVEDMGKEYGSEWEGQYRWMNKITGDFQDSDTSDSEEEAWKDAEGYDLLHREGLI